MSEVVVLEAFVILGLVVAVGCVVVGDVVGIGLRGGLGYALMNVLFVR